MSSSTDNQYVKRLEGAVKLIVKMIEMFWSEGYCFFLDYLKVAYYPETNRITRDVTGNRFPGKTRQLINSLGNNEARHLTGLS